MEAVWLDSRNEESKLLDEFLKLQVSGWPRNSHNKIFDSFHSSVFERLLFTASSFKLFVDASKANDSVGIV